MADVWTPGTEEIGFASGVLGVREEGWSLGVLSLRVEGCSVESTPMGLSRARAWTPGSNGGELGFVMLGLR